ncbi:MAG: ketoacyl-ACP synthase III [Nitrospirae bacterium]|nr:ketoacyl-ACP synthase III [Nitrospirota bacterium]
MLRTIIVGTGHHVPERVVTNNDLSKLMTTSDEWITQRTGIKERHFTDGTECGTDLAKVACERALQMAGRTPADVDLIIYATLSPDHEFPGSGCFIQPKLGITPGTPALDVRNQCSGFIYGLHVGDALIRQGLYKNVLLVGAEVHSHGLDFSDRGRDVAVLFGDGAAAVLLSPVEDDSRGVLASVIHSDGRSARDLWLEAPGCFGKPRVNLQHVEEGRHFPRMEGRKVFVNAIQKMPEAVQEVLARAGQKVEDLSLFIAHQANLRICDGVAQRLGLPPDKVYNNIQRYGNTTAASIPLALDECVRAGRLKQGDLVCLAAFGAGYTWGAALLRW